MSNEYTIQQAAELTGISTHTLRYYERIGLLIPVGRLDNGYRYYTDDDLANIRFLSLLRATGMPIRQMTRFVELGRAGDETLDERRALLAEHRDELMQHFEQIQRCLHAVNKKIAHYDGLAVDCSDEDQGYWELRLRGQQLHKVGEPAAGL
ncbi:MerR family transcriptional regulator [Ktedonosporobacter rubrisoli]|uniref:MerR family transcriptional regulator n=1 Tax=Ktedonosporobacter rubrisoli TaxID=2509675 RepID=A0A4P6JMA5_KTERU|nr:MerR family transcriptional regulator [Ktedonosporobacter rubrisoli]QBD76243.1 MerR family transcriptional regulator [Ktedonosporobacter rubrisoli]